MELVAGGPGGGGLVPPTPVLDSELQLNINFNLKLYLYSSLLSQSKYFFYFSDLLNFKKEI